MVINMIVTYNYPLNDYRNYLQHHGILGQKKGSRRAPWYPIADYEAHLRRTGEKPKENYSNRSSTSITSTSGKIEENKKSKTLAYGYDIPWRKYQRFNGTLTRLGKQRYGNKRTVFISGSSKTQDESSEYYRKELPEGVRNQIDLYMKDKVNIIVGDAPGIDRQVQDYLATKGYDKVEIYGPGKQVRYSANEKWKTNPIDASEYKEGSSEWLAKKDIAMEKAASEGLAIVIEDGARATRNNIDRLNKNEKRCKVYQLDKEDDILDKWIGYRELSDIKVPKNDDQVKQYDMLIKSLYRKQRSIYEKATRGIDKQTNQEAYRDAYYEAVRSDNWKNLQKQITDANRKRKVYLHSENERSIAQKVKEDGYASLTAQEKRIYDRAYKK